MSVAGGFLIPFCYSIPAGLLALYSENERVEYILWIPVGWPRILYYRLITSPSGHGLDIDDNIFFIIMVVCNMALYGALTYLFLLMRSLRKPKTYAEPPPPPTF